jgi:hypothetical protein
VAVGDAGKENNPHTLIVDWAQGSGWTQVSSPDPAGGKQVHMFAVSCTPAGWCVAIGSYVNSAGKFRGLIETSSDSGATWTLASADPGVPATSSQSVSCASASACMGIWSDFGGLPTAMWWNGVSWTRTKVVGPSGDGQVTELFDVSCPAATSCTAAGQQVYTKTPAGPLVEVWDGTSWTVTPAAQPRGVGQFDGISCTAPTTCTAVGQDQRSLVVPLVEVR